MALPAVESWDDDLELEGPIFAQSVSTHHASIGSRISMRSESNAGEDDWELDLAPNDSTSTSMAISSAKQAGIPIPSNVPSSALLGGAIKRLGKKPSRQQFKDDWGDDLDITAPTSDTLKLKLVEQTQKAAADRFDDDLGFNDDDGFSDWAEGSLGIRNAGTRHALKQRNSSIPGMSPSMGSCMTADSEDDGLDGLVIPLDLLNLQAALKKRQEAEHTDKAPILSNVKAAPCTPIETLDGQKEDFFADMDFGAGDVFDLKKKTLNRNVKPRWAPSRENNQTPKTQATLVFNDKNAATRIPRPVTSAKSSRLDPVFESGATNITKPRRPDLTTTSAQLLRSKRSVSGLKEPSLPTSKALPVPYQPHSNVHTRLYPSNPRITQYTSRREPDFIRAQSPPLRPHSRLSHAFTPDTPTRQRRELIPNSLAREAAAKRTITKPSRRRNFGDGTELDTFDDLPTSAAKESKFVKPPATRPPKTLRTQPSLSRLTPLRDRMTTPLPPSTPKSPAKTENLPRFARDTAASRIAREQKLGAPKPRIEQPLAPRTNWAAQVAARTPHASPTANRIRRGPQLVAPMGKENIRHCMFGNSLKTVETLTNSLQFKTMPPRRVCIGTRHCVDGKATNQP